MKKKDGMDRKLVTSSVQRIAAALTAVPLSTVQYWSPHCFSQQFVQVNQFDSVYSQISVVRLKNKNQNEANMLTVYNYFA